MKTLILSKQELDSLPLDVQNKIMQVYNNRASEIKLLKKRISKLHHNEFAYRTDLNKVNDKSVNEEIQLAFDIWQKTAGEQWGNCSGRKYTLRIGNKYIRITGYFYGTDVRNSDLEEVTISAAKLAEILDLLEESERNESDIDSEQILKVAINRFFSLVKDY